MMKAEALRYAYKGWPVFPLAVGRKQPLTPSGFKDATTSPLAVDQWWERHPDANIGVACDELFVVVDVDQHGVDGEEGLAALEQVHGALPETLVAKTGGGGRHLFFKHPGERVKSRTLVRGVDIKSDGGYVVLSPSTLVDGGTYEWLNGLEVAELPATWVAALQAPTARERIRTRHYPDAITTSSTELDVRRYVTAATPYGEAALRGEVERMKDAPRGERNSTLNGTAFNLGQLVSGGELPEQLVRDALSAAAAVAFGGDDEPGEIDGTLNSGLVAGMDNPRAAPTVVSLIRDDIVAPLVAEAVEHLRDNIGVGEAATTQVLVDTFGDRLRWVQEQRTWWICSRTTRPGFWSPEDREGSELMAHATAVAHARRVSAPGNAVAIMLGPRYAEAVLRLARPRLAARPQDFNADPWMLGVQNGVVDLRTGRLSSAEPEMLLTKQAGAAYDPRAVCPNWIEHVQRLANYDTEAEDFLRLAVGMTLVGADTRKAHALITLYGEGSNGKGAFARALARVFGDYHYELPPRELTTRGDSHATTIAGLEGRRLVTVSEGTQHGHDPGKIKDLTGGDVLNARRMRENPRSFRPSHTLWLLTNFLPRFGGQSAAARRRYMPIQTAGPLEAVDPEWEGKLASEADGILAWGVSGCVDWQARGHRLPEPASMVALRDAHLEEQDLYAAWFEARCVADPEGTTPTDALISSFTLWLEGQGVRGHDVQDFYDWLRGQGYTTERGRINGQRVRVRRGLRLQESPQPF